MSHGYPGNIDDRHKVFRSQVHPEDCPPLQELARLAYRAEPAAAENLLIELRLPKLLAEIRLDSQLEKAKS